jgi:hypothetical protein
MNTSGESSPNVSRAGRPGRAAKNLLKKTANMRAKNTGRVQSVHHIDDWDSVIGICDTAGLSAIVCE